jgi:hypothetical protein
MFIKSIIGGKGLMVNNGSPITPNISSYGVDNPSHGQLRMRNNDIEVWNGGSNGGSWIPLYGASTMVEFDSETKSILEWAKNKMEKEKKYQEMAKTNDMIANALSSVEEAEKELDFIFSLASDHANKDGI